MKIKYSIENVNSKGKVNLVTLCRTKREAMSILNRELLGRSKMGNTVRLVRENN